MHRPPVETVVHADWSLHARGRWAAQAQWREGAWQAGAPTPVMAADRFVADLCAHGATAPTLALFDFPIGVPAHYGVRTGWTGFDDAIGRLAGAVDPVAARPQDIARDRPFYPARPGGALRQHLLDAHAAPSIDALTRVCERGGDGWRAAGSLFWTLGANQVGKAALAGWREVIVPARRQGAALWPFDGDFAVLAERGGLILAESYPADGYGRLGAAFGRRASKRRQGDRAARAASIEVWAARRAVVLLAPLRHALRDGFGAVDRGGDRFDAVAGLLAALDVLASGEPVAAPVDESIRRWEGWIFGRPATHGAAPRPR